MQVSAMLTVQHTSLLSDEQRKELQRLLGLGLRRQVTDESEESDRMVINIPMVTGPTMAMETFLTIFRMLPRPLTRDLAYDVAFHFTHRLSETEPGER